MCRRVWPMKNCNLQSACCFFHANSSRSRWFGCLEICDLFPTILVWLMSLLGFEAGISRPPVPWVLPHGRSFCRIASASNAARNCKIKTFWVFVGNRHQVTTKPCLVGLVFDRTWRGVCFASLSFGFCSLLRHSPGLALRR